MKTTKKKVSVEEWWEIYYKREQELDMLPGGAQGARPCMDDYIDPELGDENNDNDENW